MDAAALKIIADIRKRKPAPVYFLQGEETYFIDLVADVVVGEFLSDAEKSFNQVVLYGAEVQVPAILTHARRFPMMSDFQVVIIREAQEISDLYKDGSSRLLLEYFTKPVPSTVLVFCHKHKTLDKRREFGKKAEQTGVVTTFKKLPDAKLAEFVSAYLRGRGFRVEDGAAALLAEAIGNDLNRLVHESDKLVAGRPEGFQITAKQVMAETGVSRDFSIFELQKAVVTKNASRVYTIVRHFQANPKKNPAIPNIAFLYSFFSKLLLASVLPDQRVQTLTSALKIPPMAAQDYAVALRNYPPDRIRENIHLLKEADLRVKGYHSGEDEGQILQETLFRLIA